MGGEESDFVQSQSDFVQSVLRIDTRTGTVLGLGFLGGMVVPGGTCIDLVFTTCTMQVAAARSGRVPIVAYCCSTKLSYKHVTCLLRKLKDETEFGRPLLFSF